MDIRWVVLIGVVVGGCESSPTAPSPRSSSQDDLVTGTIVETLTGAPLGVFTQSVDRLPALIPVSVDGFLTRLAWVTSTTPTVDLIRDAPPFDLTFYRQFARGALDGRLEPLRVLSASPSIYMQIDGLRPTTVTAYKQAAHNILPALTGGRFSVAHWETGLGVRAPAVGWITVALENDEAQSCGRALIGAPAGQVWINTAPRCHRLGDIVPPASVLAHELGHALGFWHVTTPDALMQPITVTDTPSTRERHHAALAYTRSAGNTDVDVDQRGSAFSPSVILVE